jgi:hypothetical protein
MVDFFLVGVIGNFSRKMRPAIGPWRQDVLVFINKIVNWCFPSPLARVKTSVLGRMRLVLRGLN